ncbi:MAG TPA: hypothetical protein VMQ51_02525 [Candidatus Binatia bacterium]|nr:hypothetical protein [Candidatus Binatia bacterium]
MNRALLAGLTVAMLSSGCVARVTGPSAVIEPVPPVVVAPRPPVIVAPAPVVVYPPVLVSAPSVVIVPGTQVYTVPGVSFNVFVFGGHYYSYHHGTWFHAASHGAAWTPVAVAAVPVQVRTVPAAHWKTPPPAEHAERERHCPPGHAKKGEC